MRFTSFVCVLQNITQKCVVTFPWVISNTVTLSDSLEKISTIVPAEGNTPIALPLESKLLCTSGTGRPPCLGQIFSFFFPGLISRNLLKSLRRNQSMGDIQEWRVHPSLVVVVAGQCGLLDEPFGVELCWQMSPMPRQRECVFVPRKHGSYNFAAHNDVRNLVYSNIVLKLYRLVYP